MNDSGSLMTEVISSGWEILGPLRPRDGLEAYIRPKAALIVWINEGMKGDVESRAALRRVSVVG